jgi:hypothetical protein
MSDTNEALDKLQQESEKTRTSQAASTGSPDDQQKTLEEAVADALDGELTVTQSFRDEKLAALFEALEETGQLEEVATKAGEKLGRDTEDPGKSDVIRYLIRIGLSEVDEELIEKGKEGHRQYQLSQTDEF